jgi:hypothetical protein
MRLAEAETPNPDEAQSDPQLAVLASIDLHSQHGRLVSARVRASLRKGVLGSFNRAASQAAGRAYRIVLQRSRLGAGHEEGEKEGSKDLPKQKWSKSLLCVFAWAFLHSANEPGYYRKLNGLVRGAVPRSEIR